MTTIMMMMMMWVLLHRRRTHRRCHRRHRLGCCSELGSGWQRQTQGIHPADGDAAMSGGTTGGSRRQNSTEEPHPNPIQTQRVSRPGVTMQSVTMQSEMSVPIVPNRHRRRHQRQHARPCAPLCQRRRVGPLGRASHAHGRPRWCRRRTRIDQGRRSAERSHEARGLSSIGPPCCSLCCC
jgi:hypothetical protein